MQGAVFGPPPLLCEAGRSRVTLRRASPIPGSDDADETSLGRSALVGGGLRARPGEISLAHLGVLFLDELPEFKGMTTQYHHI